MNKLLGNYVSPLLLSLGFLLLSEEASAQIVALFPNDNAAAFHKKDSAGGDMLDVRTLDGSPFPYDPQTAFPNAAFGVPSSIGLQPVFAVDPLFNGNDSEAHIPVGQLKIYISAGSSLMATLIINDMEYKVQVTKDLNDNLIFGKLYSNGGTQLTTTDFLSNYPSFTTSVTDKDCKNPSGKVTISVNNVTLGDAPFNPVYSLQDSILVADVNNPSNIYHAICVNINPLQFDVSGISSGNHRFKLLPTTGYKFAISPTTINDEVALLAASTMILTSTDRPGFNKYEVRNQTNQPQFLIITPISPAQQSRIVGENQGSYIVNNTTIIIPVLPTSTKNVYLVQGTANYTVNATMTPDDPTGTIDPQCAKNFGPFTVAPFVSTESTKSLDGKISVYPNPASDNVTIQLPQELQDMIASEHDEFGVYIINSLGQTIQADKLYGNNQVIDVSGLPAGVYALCFTKGPGLGGNIIHNTKFIKQ